MSGSAVVLPTQDENGRHKPTRMLRMPVVAQRLDVTPARAYELARAGLLPVVRLGREIRVNPDALEAWIAAGGQPLAK